MFKLLVSHGASVNAKDEHSRTPLEIVLDRCTLKYQAARALLETGAKLTPGCVHKAVQNTTETPLHVTTNKYVAIALVQAGADLTAVDHHGRSALGAVCTPYR